MRGSRRPPHRPYRDARRRPASRRTVHGNVREAAAWAIEQTLSTRSSAEPFLASAKSRCDELDHALLVELVRGTLAWLRRIDAVITSASGRELDEIEAGLRNPLRLGVYQLLFLDRVPDHAVVHEAVEQAQRATHRGGGRFVNAVLRKVARKPRLGSWPVTASDPVERLAIEQSHPTFLVRRWLDRFGEEQTREILAANNRPKRLQLLAFRDRGGRELLAEELIDEQVEVTAAELSPLGLVVESGKPLATEAFRRGDLYVQDEASQAAALVPPPEPEEEILDLAAAPGGKTFALMAWEPTVRCVASDRSLGRLRLLQENAARLRRSVSSLVMDGADAALGREFDRVVVDLPCSGTGTLRKNPELRWRLRESEIGRLADEGLRLLEGGASLVRRGGLLVAITCSIEPEENEHLFAQLLDRWPDLEALELEGRVPLPWGRAVNGRGRWQVLPAGVHDGFTVHVARRLGARKPS